MRLRPVKVGDVSGFGTLKMRMSQPPKSRNEMMVGRTACCRICTFSRISLVVAPWGRSIKSRSALVFVPLRGVLYLLRLGPRRRLITRSPGTVWSSEQEADPRWSSNTRETTRCPRGSPDPQCQPIPRPRRRCTPEGFGRASGAGRCELSDGHRGNPARS